MFRYLNHRFHRNNISFQIPDGYYLDSDPEMPEKNSVWLISPNLDFHIAIAITTDSGDTRSALSHSISDMNTKCVTPIEPLSLSGLQCHHASYHLTRSRYYEVYLELGRSELLNIVMRSANDSLYAKSPQALASLDFRHDK